MAERHSATGRRVRRWVLWGALLAVVVAAACAGGWKLMNSRTFQVAGELVNRVHTDERVVALTFDDGPTAADADAILATLSDRGIRATFYLTGEAAANHPEVVRRIVEAGHELGNHTWDHRAMVFLTPGEVARQIESTDTALREAGYVGPLTFRPPYGKKLLVTPLYLAKHERLTVMWDVSMETWDGTEQSSEDLVRLTVEATDPGSIILLHPWDGRGHVQEALGPIIDQLRADGYRFATVSELVGT